MSEDKLPEAVYRDLLSYTRKTIKTVMKLMKSDDEEVQVFVVDAFLKLSNLAAALAEALSEPTERSRNPLSRRYRGMDRGGGGASKMTEKNPRIQKWLEKFRHFLLNVPSTVTPRPSTVTPRSRRLREEEQYVLETQMIRGDIIRRLTLLYDEALAFSLVRARPDPGRLEVGDLRPLT